MTDPALGARVAAAIADALEEPVLLVGVWPDPDGGLRAVYAFDSLRVATLRHWRDEVEIRVPHGPDAPWKGAVVAFEASKWARLLLKRHGGALLTSAEPPIAGAAALCAPLRGLARGLWTDDSTRWAERMNRAPLAASAPIDAPFDAIDRWLQGVRRAADRRRGA